MRLLAAEIQLGPPGGFKGFGPLGFEDTPATGVGAVGLFAAAISSVIGIMTLIAFIWFTFQLIIGAIRILGSGGDKGALEGAKKQITSGLVGLVIVIAAVFIVSLVGFILGIPNPLDPVNLINTILSGLNIPFQ